MDVFLTPRWPEIDNLEFLYRFVLRDSRWAGSDLWQGLQLSKCANSARIAAGLVFICFLEARRPNEAFDKKRRSGLRVLRRARWKRNTRDSCIQERESSDCGEKVVCPTAPELFEVLQYCIYGVRTSRCGHSHLGASSPYSLLTHDANRLSHPRTAHRSRAVPQRQAPGRTQFEGPAAGALQCRGGGTGREWIVEPRDLGSGKHF